LVERTDYGRSVRKAVVRVSPDPARSLSAGDLEAGIERLRARGLTVRSRGAGTDEDALGVVERFGVPASVEAALNCAIRIEYA
jgi:hypothetical protein